MIIGIDASRAFLKQRTGIEEYSYQVVKHLTKELKDCQVILYLRDNQEMDFNLPENWKVKVIKFPYLWTQLGLSLEMLLHPVDILFIPAHTVPFIRPENTIVTIHGLEYEFCPEAYSFWERIYMRLSIKNSCQWAKTIIAVSNNTKNDLVNLYKVPEEKIEVIYEGVSNCHSGLDPESNSILKQVQDDRFLLFIGRLEERKNIIGIIKAFEILKEHYKIPHKLILAGKFGYGKDKIKRELKNTNCANDIILPGYVSEEEKWELIKNADVFLFPSFYEGFGLPILEAQSVGVPVVAGNNSSLPEITNAKVQPSKSLRLNLSEEDDDSAILVNPNNAEEIADAAYKLISDENLKNDIIKKGYENVKRFSWSRCAEEIAKILTK